MLSLFHPEGPPQPGRGLASGTVWVMSRNILEFCGVLLQSPPHATAVYPHPPPPCFSPVATTDRERSLPEATGSGWVCFCRHWKGKCGTPVTSCSWEKNGVLCDTPAGPPASSQWCWPLCSILRERQVLKRMQRSPALNLGSLQCWWGDGPSHSALRALTWAFACASLSRTFC